MRVEFRNDYSAAFRRLDQLTDSVRGKAAARVLNRVATSVRTAASREIRQRYNLKASEVSKSMRIARATPGKLTAVVVATGRRIPLAAFGARESRARRSRGQVTVRVLRQGGRKPVRGLPKFAGKPFLARMKSGHLGVWQRVGKARTPIAELFSISIPRGLTQRGIAAAIQKVARERIRIELAGELAFRSR